MQLKVQGLCGACYYHFSKREPDLNYGLNHHDPDVRWNAAQTYEYIVMDRQRRGIPTEGTLSKGAPA